MMGDRYSGMSLEALRRSRAALSGGRRAARARLGKVRAGLHPHSVQLRRVREASR